MPVPTTSTSHAPGSSDSGAYRGELICDRRVWPSRVRYRADDSQRGRARFERELQEGGTLPVDLHRRLPRAELRARDRALVPAVVAGGDPFVRRAERERQDSNRGAVPLPRAGRASRGSLRESGVPGCLVRDQRHPEPALGSEVHRWRHASDARSRPPRRARRLQPAAAEWMVSPRQPPAVLERDLARGLGRAAGALGSRGPALRAVVRSAAEPLRDLYDERDQLPRSHGSHLPRRRRAALLRALLLHEGGAGRRARRALHDLPRASRRAPEALRADARRAREARGPRASLAGASARQASPRPAVAPARSQRQAILAAPAQQDEQRPDPRPVDAARPGLEGAPELRDDARV